MKRSTIRLVIGILIIIVGIGIFSYPIVKQAYSSKRQSDLKQAFDDLLASNRNEQIVTVAPTDSVTSVPEQILDTPELSTDELNLVETDASQDTQTAQNIHDRLQGQVLVGLIEIDKIDLIYAIVEGTTDYNLGVAIGHMTNSVGIGEVGNCA